MSDKTIYKRKFEEDNLDEAEGFKKKEYNKIIDKHVIKLYGVFNDLEKDINFYLKKSGQGGLVGAVKKQYLVPLNDAIQNLEKAID